MFNTKTYIKNGVNYVEISTVSDFDLFQIFDCGQCFRFMPVSGDKNTVGGVAFGKYVEFSQMGDTLVIRNATLDEYNNIWHRFLSLDLDYSQVKSELSDAFGDDTFANAVKSGSGIRILRQEPWECVCSFIISQNNNIPRIRKIISALSENYGEKVDFNGSTYYAFPTPQALVKAGEQAIFDLKTGFRAKYIYDAAAKVASGELDLSEIFALDTNSALEKLCTVKGIGPKVASCALLFAFEKYDAFPIDVWVKKILAKYYPNGLDIQKLGRYAGIAQQYLFYYERYIGGEERV